MTFSLWFNLQEVWGLLFFTLRQGPFSQNPSMKMFDFFFFVFLSPSTTVPRYEYIIFHNRQHDLKIYVFLDS